jgi:hypothetical protein
MLYPSEDSLISIVQAILAAGTGTTQITGVDCAGCSLIRWLIPITTTLDTGTIAVTVQHADADSGYVDTVATVTKTDAGGSQYNGEVLVVEVAKPVKRWNKLKIVRGTANSALGAIICERQQLVADPASLDSTKVASVTRWNSPATA